jgi:predicted glycosyltransferase
MPANGEAEAALAADYNAEMVEHVERHPRVRDLSVFVGNPDDIVPDAFGPGLPRIRDWTERRFAFSGYVMGEHPDRLGPRAALREEFGFAPDEKVCIVSVGGSGVGGPLLRRAIDAFPAAERKLPGLRMLVVTGPRIDPASLPPRRGVEILGWLPDLDRRLAACDLAVVQGGLTTCMELTAAKTPFLYFPLRNHFEQNFHVRRRLERYGAGRCMDYAAADAERLAEAIAETAATPARFRNVEADGAARAAKLISELI